MCFRAFAVVNIGEMKLVFQILISGKDRNCTYPIIPNLPLSTNTCNNVKDPKVNSTSDIRTLLPQLCISISFQPKLGLKFNSFKPLTAVVFPFPIRIKENLWWAMCIVI